MAIPLQATPTRETYEPIGEVEYLIFYMLAAITILVFVVGAYRRVKSYTEGPDDEFERTDNLGERIRSAARITLSNQKQFDRDIYGGLMHSFIMWGFLTLLIATTILAFDEYALQTLFNFSVYTGDFYLAYQFAVDALGLLFIVGMSMVIYRRYWVRNERLFGPHSSLEDHLFVWSLFWLGVGGFLVEGIRILVNDYPSFEVVSFVGWATAMGFEAAGIAPGSSTAEFVHWLTWWTHSLLAFAFIAWIPFAKPFHMLSSYANVVTRDEKAGQRLPGIPSDLDATNADSIEDFTWRDRLDQDACTKCGRCSSVCPANASGRNLNPRDVILDLKSYRQSVEDGGEEVPIIADGGESVIAAETMESCMACMACMDACPVEIEHLKSFTRLNRQLVDQGDVDSNVQDVFQNLMQNGNTFGDSPRNRADWADELDFELTDAREDEVDYLWYVGDYPSYDERNKKVARSLARILDAADVSFGILFEDEKYDGNDIRRIGEEFLYLELAGHHVETFEECEFEKIICTDPHSYNTFKNEYPEVDFEEFADDPMMPFEYEEFWNAEGEVEVLHWTQAIEEMVTDGALGLDGTELDYTVTYHDPCHLGRFNDEYEAPRDLVRATGADLYEMPRNRADSYCCGGGGGGLWLDNEQDEKPSEERLREALEDTEAGDAVEKFVVACPMCMTMYEDGRKTGGYEEDIEIVDVAELLVEALDERGVTAEATGGGEAAAAGD
jgi:Fe-S oxidoreductase/nitrate reductase gamma subunit